MRKLATIRTIDDILPIPDADAIEVAVVGGWKVVVKKGEYQPGDVTVYCEVDSWIPHTIAPFLSKGQEPREYNGVKGERLRTIKLRGQLSQGLLLPYNILAGLLTLGDFAYPTIGHDVSDELGVQKYEPPVPAQLAGQVEGPWPSGIQKTDQERIQNLTAEWETLRAHAYEITEKLEGSSMSAGLVDGKFVVCSRNLNLRETEGNSLWAQARRYSIEEKLRAAHMDNIIIQGELIGEGVQGNHYSIKGQDFYVFDVLDIKAGRYLDPADRRALVDKLQLKLVPVIETAAVISALTVDQVLAMADGSSVLNAGKLREGLVFKCATDGTVHWKAVSNKYLLKTGG